MNRSRRRSKRNRKRSQRKRGGADLSPAPVDYRTVSANPQPSERVMQWATTAGAPTPCAKDMQGVAHGGRRTRRTRRRRRTRRSKHCKKRRHTRCKHRKHKRS